MTHRYHAKDRAEYIEAWTDHIRQLTSLAFAARVDHDEFIETRTLIEGWIETAAADIFPEEG